jgi:hypothetical protein
MAYDPAGQREPGRNDSDVIAFGSEHPPRKPWVTRVLFAGAAAAVIAVAAVHLGHSGDHGHRGHQARHGRPPTLVAQPQVLVRYAGPHLLGVSAGWDLFARGSGFLIRIQLASGEVTRTVVPPLESNNPQVAFLVGPHEVVVRSYDQVPGYVVRDFDQAWPLTGVLAADSPGPLLPGPSDSQAWALASGPGHQRLSLVGLNGGLTGTSIRLPPGGPLPATAIPDGRGYVMMLTSANRIYDAGPTWDRRVPSTTIATGPTGWLSVACDRHCRNVVTDAVTGVQRALPGPGLADSAFTWPTLGIISPDGDVAAVPVFRTSPTGGGIVLKLVNLRTGATTEADVAMNPAPGFQDMAWSPDSRWLFVVASGGRLVALNPRTGHATGLGMQLPPVSQVAVRPAPG